MNKQIALVAIARHEAEFIEEWVAYHAMMGINHFFIYDNGNSPSLKHLLKNFNDLVTIIPIKKRFFDKETVQERAYNDAVQNRTAEYKWLGFIDIDEFIVPSSYISIPDFLNDFKEFDQILLHWRIFGHNGFYENPDGLILESHLYRKEEVFNRVKSIIKRSAAMGTKVEPHATKIKGKLQTVDASKALQPARYNIEYNQDSHYHAHINHYQCRSYKQYMNRLKRGAVSMRIMEPLYNDKKGLNKKNRKEFTQKFVEYYAFECNKFYDDTMLQYIPKLKKLLYQN